MKPNTFFSPAPVVARGPLHLSRLNGTITDAATGWYHFTLDALWLREATVTVRLMHRGVEVKTLSTWCDAHGLLDCMDSALESASRSCELYRITPDSDLMVQVDLTIHDTPCQRDPESDSSVIRSPAYCRLMAGQSQAAWHTDRSLMQEAWEGADTTARTAIVQRLQLFESTARVVEHHEAIWVSQDGVEPRLHRQSVIDTLTAIKTRVQGLEEAAA